jgi:hypothetical protein
MSERIGWKQKSALQKIWRR